MWDGKGKLECRVVNCQIKIIVSSGTDHHFRNDTINTS